MGWNSLVSGDEKPKGCHSNGGCSSSSLNKMSTFDWLSDDEIFDPSGFKLVEVSFKSGASKDFFINEHNDLLTGDMVTVEGDRGFNVGEISLSGELVRMQLKKKGIKESTVSSKVLRRASEKDLKSLSEARELDNTTLIRARAIARNLSLDMKISDIEYQADTRKATFFFIADGRVDFRELVRHYSQEFRIKVEMRQIGARQESARIGGIGPCGRELCCSTWLGTFKSVSTSAARYQNLSINQIKLSGQCGRLKCCLNYELDTYIDILKEFPKKVDFLKTKHGKAQLIKTDIFKGLMYYTLITKSPVRGPLVAVDKERVKEIKEMNNAGDYPDNLLSSSELMRESQEAAEEMTFADVTGQIELPKEKKRNNRRNKKRKPNRNNKKRNTNSNQKKSGNTNTSKKTGNRQNSNNKSNTSNTQNSNKSKNKNQSRNKNNPNTKSDTKKSPSSNKNQNRSKNTQNKNKNNNKQEK